MFQLSLLKYPVLLVGLICYSCEYSDRHLDSGKVINQDIDIPLIDVVRDQEMLFHVYEATDSSFIGTEKWTYQTDEVKDSVILTVYKVRQP